MNLPHDPIPESRLRAAGAPPELPPELRSRVLSAAIHAQYARTTHRLVAASVLAVVALLSGALWWGQTVMIARNDPHPADGQHASPAAHDDSLQNPGGLTAVLRAGNWEGVDALLELRENHRRALRGRRTRNR